MLDWFNENDLDSWNLGGIRKKKNAKGIKINAFTVNKLFDIFEPYKATKTLISWDDLYYKVLGIIPKDVILMVWKPRWQKYVHKMLQHGYKLIITAPFYVDRWYEPLTDRYFADLYPKKTKSLSEELKQHILGGEACLWSENVDGSVLDAKLWPDAAATAENLWLGPYKIGTMVPLWDYVIRDRLKWYRCFMMQRGVGFSQIDINRTYPSKEYYLREPMYPFSCMDEADVRPIEQILPDNQTVAARKAAKKKKAEEAKKKKMEAINALRNNGGAEGEPRVDGRKMNGVEGEIEMRLGEIMQMILG